jgi:predicted transport protein
MRRVICSRQSSGKHECAPGFRDLFEKIRVRVQDLVPDLIEIAESRSVSYYAPDFFMELVPRKHSIQLLLTQSYNEIQDPLGITHDAASYTFVVSSSHFSPHQGGVLVVIETEDVLDSVMPMIRHSLDATRIND